MLQSIGTYGDRIRKDYATLCLVQNDDDDAGYAHVLS